MRGTLAFVTSTATRTSPSLIRMITSPEPSATGRIAPSSILIRSGASDSSRASAERSLVLPSEPVARTTRRCTASGPHKRTCAGNTWMRCERSVFFSSALRPLEKLETRAMARHDAERKIICRRRGAWWKSSVLRISSMAWALCGGPSNPRHEAPSPRRESMFPRRAMSPAGWRERPSLLYRQGLLYRSERPKCLRNAQLTFNNGWFLAQKQDETAETHGVRPRCLSGTTHGLQVLT